MTPKQKVLKKYAAAYSASFADCWVVFRDYGTQVGVGKSAAMAWKDAAENIAPTGCEASKPTLAEVIEYAEYLTEGDECLSVQTEILRIVTEHAARATQDALEMENKELRQRIRQFEFCIGRVAIALGGVCCGGVDVTLQQVQADPHSTTRVLCDAIAALREDGK